MQIWIDIGIHRLGLQVSTISVYGYFLFALIGRQYPSKNENEEIVDV